MAKPLAKIVALLTPKRRWAQFSLKTLLILILVSAAFLGGISCGTRWKQREVDQIRALAEWRQTQDLRQWKRPRFQLPQHLRWDFELPGELSLEEYARFLDHFGLELGAPGEPGTMKYASQLSSDTPNVRVGQLSDEFRLHLSSKPGKWRDADLMLLRRVGIASTDIVMLFFSDQAEQKFLFLETDFDDRNSQGHRLSVQKTRFGVRAAASNFEVFVIEQIRSPSSGY